jgi:DHA1 family bicyclomycin/chloramphenicol resistance-like MFS transporter
MSEPRWPTEVGSTRWIVTIAAMTGVTALSIDMSLPAQPTIASALDVSAETAQLTLSLFMIGFAVAQLVVGYLSDAWGRRPVLIAGLAMYALAGVACAASPSIEVLIACRLLQGIGASAAPVVARAMVRDTQPAAQAARLMSVMLAALSIAPMIAPAIGGAMLKLAGWRAVFGALAVCGVVFYGLAHSTLAETLTSERRVSASLGGLFRGYIQFFTARGTKLPMLIGCASFAGQFAYIADSPYVLMEGYGVSTNAFSVYFAATAVALMVGSLAGARMIRAGRSPGAMIITGTLIVLAGGVLVTLGTRIESLGISGFLIPMIIYFLGVGISGPSATALALEPVPHIAGTASAVIGFLTMISGALSGYFTTKIGGSDPRIFALVAMVMGIAAAVLAFAAARARRQR